MCGRWFFGGGEADEAVDGWALVREFLWTDPYSCFHGDPRYAVRDQEFTDGIVRAVVDRHFHGAMPDRRKGAMKVAKRAQLPYWSASMADERRPLVEARIREVYENPDARVGGAGGVTVDMGLVPALIVRGNRGGWRMGPSEHVEGLQWRGTEVARLLQRVGDAHGEAPSVTLDVLVPSGTSDVARWFYELRRAEDIVVVRQAARPGIVWWTAPLAGDLSPYRTGKASLRTDDLHSGTLEDRAEGRFVPL